MAKPPAVSVHEVRVEAADATLEGSLALPSAARGIVVFAHGSGSSRFSPRNRSVAGFLNEGGLATLLFDLLTAEEHAIDERTRELRFDIALLGRRLTGAVDWLANRPETKALRIGLFGASTGAAAALMTAVERPARVAAVVSRGGRPDLAMADLPRVKAATLLIVGGLDAPVIEMNRAAAAQLEVEHRIEIVAGATHLFEEPGKLEAVAKLAREWFTRHLG
ncbi:MAG: dienelactone hydrolase family protein [Burkholderiales bacterium]|nr:dienelactone hydrolase family protein [Burkholderiales bacterium]